MSLLLRASALRLRSALSPAALRSVHGVARARSVLPAIQLASRTLPTLSRLYSTSESKPKEGKVLEFRTETKKLLDIVANSLYSDQEIFVRELISNASDALEKLRFTEMADASKITNSASLPLELRISVDDKANTFTIEDTGVGLNEEEAIQFLGTIAKSGSKSFLENLSSKNESIIGQFGVGFYSAFVVGSKVRVYSKSAFGGPGIEWASDGSGHFEIREDEAIPRGTRIVVELKPNCQQFGKRYFVEGLIKKYSSFIGFPIYLNGERVNTVPPLWTLPKDQITPEQHQEFFQHLTGTADKPSFSLHYSVDSPINLRSVFYVPTINANKFANMDSLQAGVNLYCRKVLVQAKCQALLPPWMSFVKGAVDSEDIPLNLSREILQDSTLLAKIRVTLTNRVLKWLYDESVKDPEKFDKFYFEFRRHFEEAIITDIVNKEKIGALLRFDTTELKDGKTTSLDGYIGRMKPGQKKIYYATGNNKNMIESSPFIEKFVQKGIEVLIFPNILGGYCLEALGSFRDFELCSIEESDLEDIKEDKPSESKDGKKEESKEKEPAESADNEEKMKEFPSWVKNTLGSKVSVVSFSTRLVSHPATIADRQNALTQSFQDMLAEQSGNPVLKRERAYMLEINPNHPVIQKLFAVHKADPALADLLTHQLFENAKHAAGIMSFGKDSVDRWNSIIERVLEGKAK